MLSDHLLTCGCPRLTHRGQFHNNSRILKLNIYLHPSLNVASICRGIKNFFLVIHCWSRPFVGVFLNFFFCLCVLSSCCCRAAPVSLWCCLGVVSVWCRCVCRVVLSWVPAWVAAAASLPPPAPATHNAPHAHPPRGRGQGVGGGSVSPSTAIVGVGLGCGCPRPDGRPERGYRGMLHQHHQPQPNAHSSGDRHPATRTGNALTVATSPHTSPTRPL